VCRVGSAVARCEDSDRQQERRYDERDRRTRGQRRGALECVVVDLDAPAEPAE
jgi:hypothetical protein